MGVAAYNRGSACIARGIAADFEAGRDRRERQETLGRLNEAEAELSAVKAELSRAKRLIGLLRAEKTYLRIDAEKHGEEIERIRKAAAGAHCYAAIVQIIRIKRERQV